MNNKVLVIGLDGATFNLIDPWIKQGKLPHIKNVIDKGFRSTLLSTMPPVSAPAWTSFITGKNPGKHGILQFYDVGPIPTESGETELEIRPGDFSIVNARSIQTKTMWKIVSDADKKMVAINVPMTYPPTPVNGIMITGMLTPPGSSNFTYPPELSSSLEEYEIDLTSKERDFSFSDRGWIITRQRDMLEKRWKTAVRLMKEFDWDLFTVVFTGTDRLQHRFWQCLDPNIDTDPVELKKYGPALEEYYERLDWIVGDLIEQAGKDTQTIILSDHGFGPMPQHEINMHLLLKELQMTNPANGNNWATFLRSILNSIGLDAPARQKYLGKLMPGLLRKAEQTGLKYVWQASAARIVPLHTNIGGIWINVGETQKTSTQYKTHYEETRNKLISRLDKLEDHIDGTKIVSEVFKREEIYSGKLLHKTPDIIFVLNPNYQLRGGKPRSNSMIFRDTPLSAIQGDHLPEGILMLLGNHVQNIHSQTNFRLEDVTATILYLLGIPIPSDLDGRVVADAFDEELLRVNPISIIETSDSDIDLQSDAAMIWDSEEDKQQVEERLRDLGYLD